MSLTLLLSIADPTNKAITEQFTTTAGASGQITIAFTQAGPLRG